MKRLMVAALGVLMCGCIDDAGPGPYPCEVAERAEPVAGECALDWSCHDGAFRIQCAPDGASTECLCVQDGAQVGSFADPQGEICGLAVTDDSQRRFQEMAEFGCGWNVVTVLSEVDDGG